jgi:hypothetical protein
MATSPASARYEIRVQGHLGDQRARQFEGMAVTHLPDGITVLTGLILDQPALHGFLGRVRDMGVPLISVQRQGTDESGG